jgi:3-oxoacyl-[acyl-carrier-protein] synthase II
MEKRRVAVTGMGAVTAFGVGTEVFVDSIFAGKSAVQRISRWDASMLGCQIGAQSPEYDAAPYFREAKDARRFETTIVNAVVASKLALADSGFVIDEGNRERVGTYVGSGIGGLNTLEEQITRAAELGANRLSPFFIPNSISNMPAGIVSIETGARGPCFCIVSACATSGHCLGEAMRLIQHGYADAMIAGGTESALNASGLGGFSSMKAVTFDFNDEPERGSRPFDAKRSGFVMGEGAATLILEEWDSAVARGANIVAELVGYSATADANHFTAPPPGHYGAVKAMIQCMENAGVRREEVGYINAHGTSTDLNDKNETAAIKTVFGDHAYKLKVSSTKSMHGHLLGAAAGVESIACIYALLRNELPPTINYEIPDPDCDLDYVPNEAQAWNGDYAMCNTFGFGGQNAVILFKRAG